jgi:hypothetical protein
MKPRPPRRTIHTADLVAQVKEDAETEEKRCDFGKLLEWTNKNFRRGYPGQSVRCA